TGRDPMKIVVPVQNWYFEWCFANNYELQAALAGFHGQISYHLPSHPLLKLVKEVPFGQKLLSQSKPVDGPTVFTDGSGETGKAAVVWQDNGQWKSETVMQKGSPQVVELRAMVLAFTLFSVSVNIITDSCLCSKSGTELDTVVLVELDNCPLFDVLLALWTLIQQRSEPYFIMHIRSHTTLPGFYVEGNAHADALVSAVVMGPVANAHQQAVLSHQFFHQGFKALHKQFGLSHSQARSIAAACPECQRTHVSNYF
ncbi:POK19 protein, partial [Sapayoa aenigma]|nr:POK19 protein [Sapayoa aenigma]